MITLPRARRILPALLLLTLASAGARPVLPQDEPPSLDVETLLKDVAPFEGSFVPGLERAQELRRAGEADASLELALRLARVTPDAGSRRLGGLLAERPAVEAAQVAHAWYLVALLLTESGQDAAAAEAFERVRAAGGSSAVGRLGDLGLATLELRRAEALFQEIPEVQGRSTNAMSPGFVDDPSLAEEPGEDPIAPARAAYLAAREHLVRALLLPELPDDPRRADVRADVELVQRRLRRLDEIEEQRRQDEGQERSEDNPPDQEQPPEQSQDSQDQGTPSESDQPPPEEPQASEQEQPEQDQETQSTDEEAPEDTQASESSGDPDQEPQPSEQDLTEAERKRMEEQVRRHNDVGQEVREQLSERRRKAGEKDW